MELTEEANDLLLEAIEVIKQFILVNISSTKGLIIKAGMNLQTLLTAKLCTEIIKNNQSVELLFVEPKINIETISKSKFNKNLLLKLINLDDIKLDTILSHFLNSGCRSYQKKSEQRWSWEFQELMMNTVAGLYAINTDKLVISPISKTELMLGAFSKYGGNAVGDLQPLGDLYLSQIQQLSSKLKLSTYYQGLLPTEFMQISTDAIKYYRDIELTYDSIDKVLIALERMTAPEIISKKYNLQLNTVLKIKNSIADGAKLRKYISAPKLNLKTIGVDFYE